MRAFATRYREYRRTLRAAPLERSSVGFQSSSRSVGARMATPFAFGTPRLIAAPLGASSPNALWVSNDKWDCPAPWSITPRTPLSASISVGPPPGICAATGASTKILLPVPTKRLMVLLAAFTLKTYLPTLVVQHGALWPAAVTAVNAPSRNSPF